MAQYGKVSTVFGALVIGGSMLLPGCTGKAIETTSNEGFDPTAGQGPAKLGQGPARIESPSSLAPVSSAATSEVAHCQLEFSQNKYNGNGVPMKTDKICLDEKTDAEILKFIEAARKETCQSPFCGCWLG